MGTRTEQILVEGGRVTGVQTKKGTFEAPIVISNAGLQPTVLKLVGEEHFDKSYANYVRELVPSYSLLGHRYFLSGPVTLPRLETTSARWRRRSLAGGLGELLVLPLGRRSLSLCQPMRSRKSR